MSGVWVTAPDPHAALDMPWWRQAYVIADIALGVTILLLAALFFARNRAAARH